MELERLQKVIASAGVASRRKAEEYILAGRVKVNGKIVTLLGTKVSKNDEIMVDNKLITKEENAYYIMNKPEGYLTTKNDNLGRKTIYDLLTDKDKSRRLFSVGQLEYIMSGALLLTNDGELANKLMKKFKTSEKEYQFRIKGILDQNTAEKLIKGFVFNGKKTNRAVISNVDFDRVHESSLVHIKMQEDYNGQLKEIFTELGYEVKKMKRLSYLGISIEGLIKGSYRDLKIHEIKKLYSL